MTKITLSKPLLTGAVILLSAAYLINLYHAASQEKPGIFPMVVTVMFVPVIISAVSLLAYSSNFKKGYLTTFRIATTLCAITCAFYLFLILYAIGDYMVDIDTSIYGLLFTLPLGYLILLIVGRSVEEEIKGY